MNTVRFRIPKSVGEAIHLERIKPQARAKMVTDVRLAYDDKNVAHNELRITCSMPMAIYFVEALRHLMDKAKAQRNHVLVADCARATSSAFHGIDKAERTPPVSVHAPAAPAAVEHRA